MEYRLVGNEAAAEKVSAYVKNDSYMPLLIRGETGLGQEVLVMKAAAEILGTEEPEKHGNFFALQTEKNSIRVDAVEELLDRSRISAHKGSPKVFGIFGIGYMTKQAQNRLLKLLEDRSDRNVLLMTMDGGEVIDTIESRAVQVRLSRLSRTEMEKYLEGHAEEASLDVYLAAMRGCPYRYTEVKKQIKILSELYYRQLEIKEKKEFFSILHEVKEKDRESFYVTYKQALSSLLNMEFSIFEELLLQKEGAVEGPTDQRYRNMHRLYTAEDAYRILRVLVLQKKKLGVIGQYNRNDFVNLIKELCR